MEMEKVSISVVRKQVEEEEEEGPKGVCRTQTRSHEHSLMFHLHGDRRWKCWT